MDVRDWDGGDFELHPRTDVLDNGAPIIYLPSTDAPGYRVAVTGDPDTVERLGRALVATARKAKGADTPDDE